MIAHGIKFTSEQGLNGYIEVIWRMWDLFLFSVVIRVNSVQKTIFFSKSIKTSQDMFNKTKCL